ncbi:PadR family transcriptional regulator [Actinoallomurus iriomotensis]|uniref:PadR family transcriptional regulator n=1 Tax=Actinoallomurus iriomotensis TaxID=478107 RepID=A0A9W6VZL7_9ACTN|nr:PadR family transcriptional regulator [Actinoallomurus iriomotensis]GLY85479.1 PadR family transcriptional regulator [Actinoallomurus iriomotensis]
MGTTDRRSALGVTVLGLLSGEPMHAYRIQKLIKDYGKDRVVNVRQRASVYQTIERLLKLELIRVDRVEGHPERTVYAITDAGAATVKAWVKNMLATTGNEFPEFPVGLSFLMMLTPDEAAEQLQARLDAVGAQIDEIAPVLDEATGVARIFLVEEEYRHAVLVAEQRWLRALVADLRTGSLAWSEESLRQAAAEFDTRQEKEQS